MIWIVYDKVRIQNNKSFYNLLKEEFAKHKIETKLVYAENIKRYQNPPKVAINRSDMFECSKYLESIGVRVLNSSLVTEICNDKYKTYLFLKKHKIPCIPTYLAKDVDLLSFPFVAKSKYGHGGTEVFLVRSLNTLNNLMDKYNNDDLIFQPLVDKGKDKRCYVINNQNVVNMLRTNKNNFRANFSLGGKAEQTNLTKEEQKILNKVLKYINLDYAGVDFIYKDNVPYINEIEDIVGSRMVYKKTDINIVKLYVDYIVKNIIKHKK